MEKFLESTVEWLSLKSKISHESLKNIRDQNHVSLQELLTHGRSVVVFLRHFGCTFCRESLSDVSRLQKDPRFQNFRWVLIHMGSSVEEKFYTDKYGLQNVHWFQDPSKRIFGLFDLKRGGLRQLFHPAVWWRGFVAGILRGHLVGLPKGDPLQMPGSFLIEEGFIVKAFRHQRASDRPDYCEVLNVSKT